MGLLRVGLLAGLWRADGRGPEEALAVSGRRTHRGCPNGQATAGLDALRQAAGGDLGHVTWLTDCWIGCRAWARPVRVRSVCLARSCLARACPAWSGASLAGFWLGGACGPHHQLWVAPALAAGCCSGSGGAHGQAPTQLCAQSRSGERRLSDTIRRQAPPRTPSNRCSFLHLSPSALDWPCCI
jgi:hypothetical protein